MDMTLHAEFEKILQDEGAANRALEAVMYAASLTRGAIEPIASAYKIYLASGRLPYAPEDLAFACVLHETNNSLGLPSSLIDLLYRGL